MRRGLLLLGFLSLLLVGCSTSRMVVPDYDPGESDGVRGPKILSTGQLEYPQLAQELAIEGVINIRARVSAEGVVDSIIIVSRQFNYQAIQLTSGALRPVADVFDPLAIKFIKSLVFRPATKFDEPIPVWILQPVRWKMAG